jgi:hypothetical protein
VVQPTRRELSAQAGSRERRALVPTSSGGRLMHRSEVH